MMPLPVWMTDPMFLLGFSVPGPMFLPEGEVSVKLCPDTPNQKSGRYASYWNAFLVMIFQLTADKKIVHLKLFV